jgi:hypothetical protein
MSEDQTELTTSRFSEHKLIFMIVGSIFVALILTVVSMSLYTASGAAQVDLSRPGYRSVQKEAKSSEKFDGFSASGEINEKVLEDFKKIYNKQAQQVSDVNAFGTGVLDDATLKIDDPALLPEATQ